MKNIIFITGFFLLITSISLAAVNSKTVGTASRDYTTWQLCEDDLDDGTNAVHNSTAYGSGDDAECIGHDDSDFTAGILINGGGTVGLNSRTFTVTSTMRHDGVANGGVRILGNFIIESTIGPTDVEYIEMNGNNASTNKVLDFDNAATTNGYYMLIHDYGTNSGTGNTYGVHCRGGDFTGNIFYDLGTNSSGGAFVAGFDENIAACNGYNNTIHNLVNNNGTGAAGAYFVGGGNWKNNVGTDCASGSTSGAEDCFNTSGEVTNACDDASCTGQTSITLGDTYVSTTPGSEDLHIQDSSSALYDNGTDVSADLAQSQTDVDGDTRPLGSAWDIGADECKVTGGEACEAAAAERRVIMVTKK